MPFANVIYYQCDNCGFLFTPYFDKWSTKKFSRRVYNDKYANADPDYTGKRSRQIAQMWVENFGDAAGEKILDYGSGEGLFGKILRQKGFGDVTDYDPFSRPIRPEGTFRIITAFEVVEHSTIPRYTFDEICGFLNAPGMIVFSTQLVPTPFESNSDESWYVSPRNGHASCYSIATLQTLAARLGGELSTDGNALHAFSFGGYDKAPQLLAGAQTFFKLDAERSVSVFPTGNRHYIEKSEEFPNIFYWVGPKPHIEFSAVSIEEHEVSFEIRIPIFHPTQIGGGRKMKLSVNGKDTIYDFPDNSELWHTVSAECVIRPRLVEKIRLELVADEDGRPSNFSTPHRIISFAVGRGSVTVRRHT
jgi:hypothetical protein